MTLTIRSATTKDISELMRLAEQWLNPLWNKVAKRYSLDMIIHALYRSSWTHHFIIVAEIDNKLVAFVDYLQWEDWLIDKNKILIQHVYVDEGHRQQGIGTAMLNHIINPEEDNIESELTPHYIFVDTKPDKFPYAEKLYKKVGLIHNNKRKWMERYK